ncbi:CatB-related O-acetyltransferase [Heyndrickxia ginsengihumi]|uniref:CatB-related O-acetyltransferase n=1 Tax=Heyndrickxia ginsengihumi TaxID=363870 RepID=UPI003D1C258C
MRELYRKLVCFIRKCFFARKKCKFDPKSFFDKNSNFEGRNRLGYNTRIKNTKVGYASYIASNTNIYHTVIGKYSSIGPNVQTLIGRHPTNTYVSTHPSFFSRTPPVELNYVNRQKFQETKSLDDFSHLIEIGNDVWIGGDVSIIDGVTINDGAIVAAGAVVIDDVPAYSIVAGVPAKVIRYRFDDDIILFLKELKWWNKNKEWIEKYADYFEDIKKLKEVINTNGKS